jgi:hypothetical protein
MKDIKEIHQALLDGKKLRHKGWGDIVDSKISKIYCFDTPEDWEICDNFGDQKTPHSDGAIIEYSHRKEEGLKMEGLEKYNGSILAKLAHIDRCLFPKDFEEELIKLGVDDITAYMIGLMVEKDKGIVEIYQEFIENENICKILDRYVESF